MHQKAFKSFLESLKTDKNHLILEAIDHGFNVLLEAMSIEEKYDKFWKEIIKPKDFKKIVEADPTKKKAFVNWMIDGLYKNNALKMEDLYKATNYLKIFIMYRNHLPKEQQDIMNFKSLPELYKAIEPFKPDTKTDETDETDKIDQEKIFLGKGEAEKFYEDDRWKVIIPNTLEASKYFGKGTEWCTLHENMFDHYTSQGPLYINFDKKENRKYQFHFESNQFTDEKDSEVYISEIELPPKLYDIYVNKFNFEGYPGAIKHFAKEKRMGIFNKFPETFGEAFKYRSYVIGRFPSKNRMEILNRYPESFERDFRVDPTFIAMFPKKNRTEIFNKFPSLFKKVFEQYPDTIEYFPEENWTEIKQKIQELKSKQEPEMDEKVWQT